MGRRIRISALWAAILVSAVLNASHARSARVALVIGNADYVNEPLPNAVRDAALISKRLRQMGFAVATYSNLDASAMNSALHEFEARLSKGDTGLLYFSGHGVQIGDTTLMLPTDLSTGPASILKKGIDLKPVLDAMALSGSAHHHAVILDTCLNNPFSKTDLRMSAIPNNVSVAYAAAPGGIAGESQEHGVFTAELARRMTTPAFSIDTAMGEVSRSVSVATGGKQVPWLASSREPGSTVLQSPISHGRGILPKDSDEQYELTFWDSIKDSTFPTDYEAYLKAYPNGRFATLAHARIDRLRAAASKGDGKSDTQAQPHPRAAAPASPPSAPVNTPKPAPVATVQSAPATPPTAPPKTIAVQTTAHEIKDCSSCPAMISLNAGAFSMGSNSDDPAERPVHRVSIGQPFAIGKYEVTVGEWNACVAASGCPHIDVEGDASAGTPVRNVSWDDAQLYAKWLSKTTTQPYRLPTESEWEYAARGGTSSPYWWGEKMQKGYADCKECGEPYRADSPVNAGSYAANPFGLFDMSGSVWEWVGDCWHGSFKGAPADGRMWDEAGCPARVIRGGSWKDGAAYMQSSTRFKYSASVRQSQNGFRVARDLK